MYVKLSELKVGECGIIKDLTLKNNLDWMKIFIDRGFLYGEIIEVAFKVPWDDYYIYKFMNDIITIDGYSADYIIVEKIEKLEYRTEQKEENNDKIEYKNKINKMTFCDGNCKKCYKKECNIKDNDKQKISLKCLLVGNPNCGKTTLFNLLTGSHERVGNYAGVTVEEKKGYCYVDNFELEIYDLPGTYSLDWKSDDEKCTVDFINNKDFDIIINVLNSLILKRSLYLTEKLKEVVKDKNKKIICAFNFYDRFINEGYTIDLNKFEKNFDIITLPIISENGYGVNNLVKKIISLFKND